MRRSASALTLLASATLAVQSCHVAPFEGADRPPARVAHAGFAPQELDQHTAAVTQALDWGQTGLRPDEVEALAAAILAEARRADLPPELVLAIISVESGGHNFAVSRVGALGLMQLRPETARGVARRVGIAWRGPETLFDPVTNVRLGVRYLESLVARFGSLEVALAAYNWGPSRIAARLERGEDLPLGYTERVLGSRDRSSLRSPSSS